MVCSLCVLFWVAAALIVFKLYLKLTTGWCRRNACLVGKTAIVTGANSGIGYETAEDFAKRGAKVIIACRDIGRGTEAMEKIIRNTDNQNIIFKQMDLGSLESVRKFAEDMNKTEERLDILVNNAGVGNLGLKQSQDNLDLLMQVNYFGHFLLTTLLLDLLKKSKNARIVNVSSLMAKFKASVDVNSLNQKVEKGYKESAMYGRSKLSQIYFTIELAKRLKGTSITAYSLHPGVVVTNIFNKMPPVMKFVFDNAFHYFCKSPIEGAQTTIYCSVEKSIEHLSGQHFHDCHVVERYKTAMDPDVPKKLWEVSEELVGIKKQI